MSQEKPQPIYRKDYRPPAFWIDTVDLRFELGEEETVVRSRLALRRGESVPGSSDLVLDGEQLELRSLRLDGRKLEEGEYRIEERRLIVPGVPERFTLESEVAIKPQENKALSGLYKSSGNFCTQCEAEGFRRITYFLDRPDVMARYTSEIVAERERYPVLLSNGNRVETRDLEDGRHLVRWEDPFPKPSYLFALVAGDLRCHEGRFTTASGRDVRLEIWVEPQNLDRCEHALSSLKRAMRWDEERFGREVDLDVYMIVAVNDFNMGAMENKGLNIFNSKYVLARPETATDEDYEHIEGVIAHEYFHNWTGNRITCRDWFQLTLKEGLTVFRDQLFSAEMTSAAVKRIEDVKVLRTAQFAEDAGPMAHPIRPESYIEMNNFYTTTVYNKGAEVVRMFHTLLGPEGFRRGMDLYFERHDSQAVTCDDFRAAMADANDADLEQFARWYSQAGTPRLRAEGSYDEARSRYTLTLSQSRDPVPGAGEYLPMHIPVAVGLVGEEERGTRVLELRESSQSFEFQGVGGAPVPSVLRGFSAPVKLEMERGREELAFLMSRDADPFNRWDAGQELARRLLLEMVAERAAGRELRLDPLFIEAFSKVLAAPDLDGSLKALALLLPGERVLAQHMEEIDVDGIHAARRQAAETLASELREELLASYESTRPRGPYSSDRAAIERRRLCNTALLYLALLDGPESGELIELHYRRADNMTDSQAALALLADMDCPQRTGVLEDFYERWRGDPLVIDKWFGVQAFSTREDALEQVLELVHHPDFTLENPNRVRALVSTFCAGNPVRFHSPDGRGYSFLAGMVLALDAFNPQLAARMTTCFNQWKRYDPARRALMQAQLEHIASSEGLSKDVFEIATRALEN